jgi:ectoine hydroxylase-related dioxygenase (phytanoyl-CoA dioxygenase family)
MEFTTTVDNLRKTLDEYGVAIIPSVLDDEECEVMLKEMWDFFEEITGHKLKRDDRSTWREFYKLYPLHSMLIQYYGIGHAQFAWNLRQNPKIISIFSKLYDCSEEDLLVSFDGSSLHLPPEVTRKGWFNNKWLHTDQSFLDDTTYCIQSWVTALDVNEDDATLLVLEKSHLFHKQFGKEHGKNSKDDWYKLSASEVEWYKKVHSCEERRVKCPRGSLVLWNSKTIHCGVEPLRTRGKENIRAVSYLCYQPKTLLVTKKDLEKCLNKKQKAFLELRTTTHWPLKSKLFGKNPRTYGGDIPEINPISRPMLTEVGKKLAGFF